MKIGLLGLGQMGSWHREIYKKLEKEDPEICLEAVCDLLPEHIERDTSVRAYHDIDEFLKSESSRLDYIDICLPTDLHAETSIKAMKMGLHVLCEKPMALNYEDAVMMCNTAKHYNRTLMVAQCMRFNPYMTIMERYIRSKEIGTLKSASFTRFQGVNKGTSGWFLKHERSGGVLVDLHVHDADLVQFFFGMPKAVSVVARNLLPGSAYDCLSVHYLYDNGFYVRGACDWTLNNNHFESRTFRVNFSEGYLFNDRGDAGRNAFYLVREDGTEKDLTGQLDGEECESEIRYLIQCLKERKPVLRCTPESTAETIRLVMAEKASADKLGEKVFL